MVKKKDKVEVMCGRLDRLCRFAIDLIHVRLPSVKSAPIERMIAVPAERLNGCMGLYMERLQRKTGVRHGSKVGGNDKDVSRDYDR